MKRATLLVTSRLSPRQCGFVCGFRRARYHHSFATRFRVGWRGTCAWVSLLRSRMYGLPILVSVVRKRSSLRGFIQLVKCYFTATQANQCFVCVPQT